MTIGSVAGGTGAPGSGCPHSRGATALRKWLTRSASPRYGAEVPSVALVEWNSRRAQRVQDLLGAHERVGGVGVGRRWRTEQLNWALVLRVAAEFQGYCRDLHDLAAEEIAVQAGQLNGQLQAVVRSMLTEGRRLDGGNANAGNLGSDFGRLGLSLWPEIKRHSERRAAIWNARLDALNDARNAVAHDDTAKLAELAIKGYPLSRLATIRRFYSGVSGLALITDRVVADYLRKLLGGASPW